MKLSKNGEIGKEENQRTPQEDFDARESEDEKIKKVEKAAAEVYQKKRQNLESSGDEEDEVHIVESSVERIS